jgi:hypothetical protein
MIFPSSLRRNNIDDRRVPGLVVRVDCDVPTGPVLVWVRAGERAHIVKMDYLANRQELPNLPRRYTRGREPWNVVRVKDACLCWQNKPPSAELTAERGSQKWQEARTRIGFLEPWLTKRRMSLLVDSRRHQSTWPQHCVKHVSFGNCHDPGSPASASFSQMNDVDGHDASPG